MNNIYKNSLVLLSATGLLTQALATYAQEQAGSQGQPRATVEEVIVTAQRVEANLQNVPVAVTSLNEDALANARVATAHDLQGLVPNLWIVPQSTSPANPSVTIRGVNSNVSLTTNDGGVAFYIDDVYVASNMGAVLEVADIERVEVLRGPQGTLFGRNTTGGAVNFITRAPSGEFGIRQDLSFGNYSLFSSRTRLDTPVWNNLSASLTYFTQERDGDVKNLTPGRVVDYTRFMSGRVGKLKTPGEMGSSDSDSLQLALRYEPSERLLMDYRYTRTESENVPKAIQVLGFANGGGGGFTRLIYSLQPPGTPNFVSGDRLSAVSNPYVSAEFLELDAHSLTVNYEINDRLRVRSISSYRELDNFSVSDLGGGGGLVAIDGSGDPFTIFTGLNERSNDQKTQELQLIGSHEKVDWVTGLYYSEINFPTGGRYSGINHILAKMPTDTQGGEFFPRPPLPRGFVENKAYAVFGQATWHYSEQLDITLGVRQSRDERTGFSGQTQVGFDKKFNHTDWTAILTYFLTDDITTYGKLSTGYLSAGVSGAEQVPFDEEEVLQAEVGLKGDFYDKRLRSNIALFWSDYSGIQILDFSTGEVRFVNAAEAGVYGLEVELTAIPTAGLTLGASYGYTNFDYDEFFIAGVDVKDTQRAWFRPEHTANLNAEYQLGAFSWGGEWSGRIEAQYLSKVFFTPVLTDQASNDNSIADARWVLNARTTIANIPVGNGLTGRVSLWGKNLTNTDELEFAAAVGTTVIGSFMTPRTYGMDLTVEF